MNNKTAAWPRCAGRRTGSNGSIGGRAEPGHETEKRFLTGQRHLAKRFAHDRRDLRRPRALR